MLHAMLVISNEDRHDMTNIVDMRTRKKWARPKPRKVAAQAVSLQKTCAGFEPIGRISARLCERLAR